MIYSDLISASQDFEKLIMKDVMQSVPVLESKMQILLNEVQRARMIRPLLQTALCESLIYLQDHMKKADEITLDKCVYSNLVAMFEVDQDPLLHQVIDVYNEVIEVSDKLKVVSGLKKVISGCTHPVRRETRRLKRPELDTDFYKKKD